MDCAISPGYVHQCRNLSEDISQESEVKVGIHQGSVLSSLLCQLIDFTNSVQKMRDFRTVLKTIMLIIALLAYTFVLTELVLRCILLFTFCLLSSVVVTRPRATTVNNTRIVEVYICKIILLFTIEKPVN